MISTRSFGALRLLAGLLILLWFSGCNKAKDSSSTPSASDLETSEESDRIESKESGDEKWFKLSLAQWSLHKMIQSGELDPVDFAQKARELGFSGIEYVSQLYTGYLEKGDDPEKAMEELLMILKDRSAHYQVDNVLIMVDGEGHLAELDDAKRNQSVENHKKWVDAAAFLGCHSIRVNAHGEGSKEEVAAAAVKGLSSLARYAADKGINVIVENHGGYTSSGKWLSEVMKEVNLPNCGTLPDFGNFCINVSYGSINAEECEDVYDIYQGVAELLPYAKGVSAKTYDFDDEGNQPLIDYYKMMKVVKDGGYTGYIGVEFEGESMTELEGIEATRRLILKAADQLK
jgi:sugar phosphate isomerase/epimerase